MQNILTTDGTFSQKDYEAWFLNLYNNNYSRETLLPKMKPKSDSVIVFVDTPEQNNFTQLTFVDLYEIIKSAFPTKYQDMVIYSRKSPHTIMLSDINREVREFELFIEEEDLLFFKLKYEQIMENGFYFRVMR